MKKFYDVVFVGAGLANSLAAYRLSQLRPEVEFLILDAEKNFGGNHTWSFHDSDISEFDFNWMEPFIVKSWKGTDVRFAGHARTLSGGYHSISSARLHEVLASTFHYQLGLDQTVVDLYEDLVVLKSGFNVQTGCVVDGRGWEASPTQHLGYQKFSASTSRSALRTALSGLS